MLTEGVLAKVMRGEETPNFVVQVLGSKLMQSSGQDKYRLLISDGLYTMSFSLLASQLSHLVQEQKLDTNTVIRIKKYNLNQVAGGKKVLIIMDVDVLKAGKEVGQKIGSPVALPNDGSAPPPSNNQNKDPNAGALKRPADTGVPAGSTLPAKLPATNRSVLSSKSSGGISGSSGAHVVTPINAITPYQNKWTIKARVTSKSDIRTWNKPSGSGKLFSVDLMDDSGEIRATAFKDQCDQYYDVLQVGKVYYFSRCAVKAANKAYSKLRNDYELTFKDNVLVELAQDNESSDVPTMSYNFASISDLSGAGKDTIVDIIGICKMANDSVTITTRTGKELTKREVVICDKTNSEVTLTLWGTTAENFTGDNNPVLAVKGSKVSDFNGVGLSGGDVMINPDLAESHALKGWWDEVGCNTNFTSLTVQGQRGAGAAIDPSSIKSIAEVKLENLGYNSDRGDYYSCVASITFFSKDKALYKACSNKMDDRECNKKIQENGDGSYRCEKCSLNLNEYKWRLMLSMNMGDFSDGVWVTCFQETAEKILGCSSEEVGKLSEEDEDRYNAVFARASFKSYAFRLRAKADTYNDETRVKHTVVSVEPVDYPKLCRQYIKEIEDMGGVVPDSVKRDKYI